MDKFTTLQFQVLCLGLLFLAYIIIQEFRN